MPTDMPNNTRLAYAPFHAGFVVAAIGVALTTGFGYATMLAWVAGFELSAGNWWAAMIQAHGHAQLMGWVGLFIMGVSLYFVPRLAGVPLSRPALQTAILIFLTAGILLRTITQPLLPEPLSGMLHPALRSGLAASGILEISGVCLYIFLLITTMNQASANRKALIAVRPFFLMVMTGWVCYTAISSGLVIAAAWQNNPLLPPNWNRFHIDLFVRLVLLPIAFAFSIRTFPLYLRLPPANWAVNRFAAIYLLAVTFEQLPILSGLSGWPVPLQRVISGTGQCLTGLAILFFVWRLDLLFRRRMPWTVNRVQHPDPDRKPTRKGLPDYGEFGRFEWLLYAAYTWLVIAAVLDCVIGFCRIVYTPSPIAPDAIRHIYLMGFISLLILGMAARMIPGFLHKRQIAHPGLVAVIFWVALCATFCRVMPILFANALQYLPYGSQISSITFGLSGFLGWVAIAISGWNLWATYHLNACNFYHSH